jgi:hypothetical protein
MAVVAGTDKRQSGSWTRKLFQNTPSLVSDNRPKSCAQPRSPGFPPILFPCAAFTPAVAPDNRTIKQFSNQLVADMVAACLPIRSCAPNGDKQLLSISAQGNFFQKAWAKPERKIKQHPPACPLHRSSGRETS